MNTLTQLPCPFVGLRPFESDNSLFYFGRAQQIQALLQKLDAFPPFLAVIGSSGCGKSSLVRAGLIPALQAGFLVQQRDRWHLATMKPGESPILHLAEALLSTADQSVSTDQIKVLAEELFEEGVEAALDRLEKNKQATSTNLLLVVDQFEELFRYGLNHFDPEVHEKAESFVALLLRLSEQKRLPIYLCITMRADFLGGCDAFSGLPEAISKGLFLVPQLTRAQRRQVITAPVSLAGAEIAPRLVDLLLNERLEIHDDLPILQHLLMRCWKDWSDAGRIGSIDLEHYEHVHTIHKALDTHAEEALNELPPQLKTIARRLFQALTELDDGNRRIRRPAHLSDIRNITGASQEELKIIIKVFRDKDRNFLVQSTSTDGKDQLLDISHESLIRQWRTLHEWVDQEAVAAKLYRRLTETAALHEEDDKIFYSDTDIKQARELWRSFDVNDAWAKRYPGDFAKAEAFLRDSRLNECCKKKKRKQSLAESERLRRENEKLEEKQERIELESQNQQKIISQEIAKGAELTKEKAKLAVEAEEAEERARKAKAAKDEAVEKARKAKANQAF